MPDAVGLLRGAPASNVTLAVVRGDAAPIDFVITRSTVEIQQVLMVARAQFADDVAAFASKGSFWGVVYEGRPPEELINWTNDMTDQPLLVGPASYDIYLSLNTDEPPRLIASGIEINGTIIDVPISLQGTPPPAK